MCTLGTTLLMPLRGKISMGGGGMLRTTEDTEIRSIYSLNLDCENMTNPCHTDSKKIKYGKKKKNIQLIKIGLCKYSPFGNKPSNRHQIRKNILRK